MSKGPKLNFIDKSFTTRDNLGIESIATSIQRELCPIVNTVTPRAFYWAFMVWNYYDFYKNHSGPKNSYDDFDKPFLKKNDYYFVLSNLMNSDSDQNNLVGKDKTGTDLLNNPTGSYGYNIEYFVTRFGGMQYYNAGCLTMGFITDTNQDGTETYKLPKLTKEFGEPLAKAFEEEIKNTQYYKKYRLSNTKVPREVLEEFGSIVTLDMKHLDKCKELLREALFSPKQNARLNNTNLIKSANFLKMINSEYGITDPSLKEMREILFDYFSPRSMNKPHQEEHNDIIGGWETVVGRQYLSIAIENIWKYMLRELSLMTLNEWIEMCINNCDANFMNLKISDFIDECNYSFLEREELVLRGAGNSSNIDSNIENAIKVIFSIYNRFKNREDLNKSYLEYGDDVSIASMIRLVDEFVDLKIKEFVAHIMKNWIVERHERVALNKMSGGRDGYFIERIDNMYIRRATVSPEFQGIRLIQLMQVMKDLDMIGS